jgi:hypothetical protein
MVGTAEVVDMSSMSNRREFPSLNIWFESRTSP